MSGAPGPAEQPRIECANGAVVGDRDEQQDASRFRLLPDGSLLMVLADGMGGHAGGALAARIAVESCLAAVPAALARGAPFGDALSAGLDGAVVRISRAMEGDRRLAQMGATLVVAIVSPDGLRWLSVGDSPMWLSRGGVLTKLNEDHSLRESEAAAAAGKGNMLLSVVNGEQPPYVDLRDQPFPLRPGDRIVVASDGVLTLDEAEIAPVVSGAQSPAWAVAGLLEAVEAAGKRHQDNCTLVVAEVPGRTVEEPARPRSRGGVGKLPVVAAAAVGGIAGLATPAAVFFALFR